MRCRSRWRSRCCTTPSLVHDDLLNLVGDGDVYGKEVDGDLYEGKRTLVLIHLIEQSRGADRATVASPAPRSTPSPARVPTPTSSATSSPTSSAATSEWRMSRPLCVS